MLVTTTPTIEGRKITKYCGVVAGEAILGANVFKDLFAEIRSAEQLLMQARVEEERVAATARLRLLLERMGSGRAMTMQVQSQYFEKLVERLGRAGQR